MYGVEANASGLGGLAAQAPGDPYFAGALGIQNTIPVIANAQVDPGSTSPVFGPSIANQLATGLMSGSVSGNGQAVRVPITNMHGNWSSVLDFHNSPAPWILLAILVLYGWLHVSVRANAGRRASAAVVL